MPGMSPAVSRCSRCVCQHFAALSLVLWFVGPVVPLLHSASGDTSGIITGRVTNESTGDVLTHVVTVEGAAASTTTDRNGMFRLTLPAGERRPVVSYPGFDAQRLAVALTSALYKMDKFIVKGMREGQAAAIQEDRQAANVRTVAAIDAFGHPGAAIGEMLQRLPGVAVDGSGGEVGAIYIRGMTQDFSSLLVEGGSVSTLHP